MDKTIQIICSEVLTHPLARKVRITQRGSPRYSKTLPPLQNREAILQILVIPQKVRISLLHPLGKTPTVINCSHEILASQKLDPLQRFLRKQKKQKGSMDKFISVHRSAKHKKTQIRTRSRLSHLMTWKIRKKLKKKTTPSTSNK